MEAPVGSIATQPRKVAPSNYLFCGDCCEAMTVPLTRPAAARAVADELRADPHAAQASTEPAPPKKYAEGREFILMVTFMMAMGAISIDLMLPAFADMRKEFGMVPDSPRITWMITAFFLGLAVGPWFFGPPSDRYGRKPLLHAGIVLYVLSAVAAVLAPNFATLVAVRFVWGIAAGAPRALTLAMIRDRYSGEDMARLMSLIMAVFILVPVLAPALGAGLMTIFPWRVVFWVPGIWAIAVAVWARRMPETLPPERRRPPSRGAFRGALKAVVSNRQTVCFGLAVAFLFGVMSAYLSSSELIFDKVYDKAGLFPVLFGIVALMLGVGSLISAHFVTRFGLLAWMRRMTMISLVLVGGFAVMAWLSQGRPTLWVLVAGLCIVIPSVQALIPNCNTAAMVPLGHVAGTASAIIGTVSTAGGALIGNVIAGRFEGTIRPFAVGALLCVVASTVCIAIGVRSADDFEPSGVNRN